MLNGALSLNGVGVQFRNNGAATGSITVSGSIAAGTKDVYVQDSATTYFTGNGTWTGGNKTVIRSGGTLVAARTGGDPSRIASTLIQIDGGTLRLGNNEQIHGGRNIGFLSNGSLFDVDGYSETIKGFATVAGVAGDVAMGDGGAIHLYQQSSSDTIGGLNISEWAYGEDHIYVDGGGFSASQLSVIAFDGYDAGAKVLGGELVPVAIPEPAVIGLFALFGGGVVFVRRLMM